MRMPVVQFPNLKESTVRNFKVAYKDLLVKERRLLSLEPVAKIPVRPATNPSLNLMKSLRAVRTKGGVVNIHVVRATTKALVVTTPSKV